MAAAVAWPQEVGGFRKPISAGVVCTLQLPQGENTEPPQEGDAPTDSVSPVAQPRGRTRRLENPMPPRERHDSLPSSPTEIVVLRGVSSKTSASSITVLPILPIQDLAGHSGMPVACANANPGWSTFNAARRPPRGLAPTLGLLAKRARSIAGKGSAATEWALGGEPASRKERPTAAAAKPWPRPRRAAATALAPKVRFDSITDKAGSGAAPLVQDETLAARAVKGRCP